MQDNDRGRENCDKLIGILEANGFVDYLICNNYTQVNAYISNGETITYMCRSEKILCHAVNESGMKVMKWCGETGIKAFLAKLGIDYDDGSEEIEQFDIMHYITGGDI